MVEGRHWLGGSWRQPRQPNRYEWLDKAVQTTIDWIEQNGGFEENQLIVTADHDHYLTLNEDFPKLLREKGAEALTENDPAGHYWGSDPMSSTAGAATWTAPCQFTTKVIALKLDGLVGEGYESYGSKVPGIEGLVDQPTSIRPMRCCYRSSTAFPSQSPKQKQNHPSICCCRRWFAKGWHWRNHIWWRRFIFLVS